MGLISKQRRPKTLETKRMLFKGLSKENSMLMIHSQLAMLTYEIDRLTSFFATFHGTVVVQSAASIQVHQCLYHLMTVRRQTRKLGFMAHIILRVASGCRSNEFGNR